MSLTMMASMPSTIANAENVYLNEGYLLLYNGDPCQLYQYDKATNSYQQLEDIYTFPSSYTNDAYDERYTDRTEWERYTAIQLGLAYYYSYKDADELETQVWLKKHGLTSNKLPDFYYKQKSDDAIPTGIPQEVRIPMSETWEAVDCTGSGETYGLNVRIDNTVNGPELVVYEDPNSSWTNDGSFGCGEVQIRIHDDGKDYRLYARPILYRSAKGTIEIENYLKGLMLQYCGGMSETDTMYTMTKYLYENFQHTNAGGSMYGTLFNGEAGDCWVYADLIAKVAQIMGVHFYERRPYILNEQVSNTHYNVCVQLDGQPYIVDASSMKFYKTQDGVCEEGKLKEYASGVKVTEDGLYAYKEYGNELYLLECFDMPDSGTVYIPEEIDGKRIDLIGNQALYSGRDHYITPNMAALQADVVKSGISDVTNYNGTILREKKATGHASMCKTYFYPAGTKVYNVYKYSEDRDVWFWSRTRIDAPDEALPVDSDIYRYELKYVYTEDTWEGAWYGGDASSWKPYTYVTDETPDDIDEEPVPETTITEETTTEATTTTEKTTTEIATTTEETTTEVTSTTEETTTEVTTTTEETTTEVTTTTEETTTEAVTTAIEETTTSTDVVPIQYNIPLLEADNNSDGSVNASDAAAILVYASLQGAGANTDMSSEHMDVNGDGLVNATDASVLLEICARIGAGNVVEYLDEYRVSQEAPEE